MAVGYFKLVFGKVNPCAELVKILAEAVLINLLLLKKSDGGYFGCSILVVFKLLV